MTADLALVASDPGFLERSADPGEFVIQACERAKDWLREALDKGEIDQIAELKSQAEAARIYAVSKQYGKDAELSAAEIVRRAERGLGLLVRQGQEAGLVNGRGRPSPKNGTDSTNFPEAAPRSPGEYVGTGGERSDTYAITDGFSDEEFEQAIGEARTEGNLSRANVARKARARQAVAKGDWIPEPGDNHGAAPVQRRKLIRQWATEGFTSRQIGERLGMHDGIVRRIARECGITIGADESVLGTRRIDSARITRETVHTLEAIVTGIELVDFGDLDPAEAKDWAVSLTASIRSLNRFARQIRETAL